MKREDLEKLGLNKEQVDAVCDMHHEEMRLVKEELQNAQDDLKIAQEKVKTTEEALKKFDGIDAEALEKQIENLKEDLDRKEKEYMSELADRDFGSLLKDAITEAKGKNVKAITALLDIDTLKASKNQKEDITAALKELSEAEDSKMLFGGSEPQVVGTGNPIGTVTKGGMQDSNAAMRAAMGLPATTEQ